jgi:muconate cycloisomerase
MSVTIVQRAATDPVERDEAPLRITSVEAVAVALPLTKPVVMAGESIDRSQNLLVRVEAANGLVGWGEASSAPLMTGDVLPGMVCAINQYLAPLVIGADALRRAELGQRCAGALLGNTGAKCALDMAINDLVGRHLDVSLADLFGGRIRDVLQPMYLLGNAKVEDDVAEAQRKLAEGFRFFKLKIGIKRTEEEAAAALAIRRQLGDAVALCADANMGMSFADARLFAERACDANLLFMEQPLRAEDFDGMAALARVSPIPLNGDESVSDMASLLTLHRLGAVQGANIKTIKMGGVAPVAHAMTVCGALGFRINLACKVAESTIAAAALAQLGAIAPNLDWGLNVTNHYLGEDLSERPVRIENGEIRVSRGAGLGVEISEERVRRYQIR